MSRENFVRDLIRQAVKMLGSQGNLARACGVSQPSISGAIKSGSATAELALGIHHATNGAVPASLIRPDLWATPDAVPKVLVQRNAKRAPVKRAKAARKLGVISPKVRDRAGVAAAAAGGAR